MNTTQMMNRFARLSEYGINRILPMVIRTFGQLVSDGLILSRWKLPEQTNRLLNRCGWHFANGALDEVSKGYCVLPIQTEHVGNGGGMSNEYS